MNDSRSADLTDNPERTPRADEASSPTRRPYAPPAIEHTGALEAVTLATGAPMELTDC